MKTSLGRQLFVNIGLVLLAFILLGGSLMSLLYSYLLDREQATLESTALSISDLGSAYSSTGTLTEDFSFRMTLSFAAQASGADIQICDLDGTVVLCSDDALFCDHIGLTLPEEIVSGALETSGSWYRGTLENFYEESRMLIAIAVLSDTDEPISIVVVSTDSGLSSMADRLLLMYVAAMLIALLVTILVTIPLTRKQVKSQRELAAVARQYGSGDFSVRLEVGKHDTVEQAELTQAFNAMADSLELSDKRRSEFIANVSHELKTPMTTIGGFVDGMLDGTIPPERHQQYLQAISDEVKRLSRLVRSMLEVSRLQAEGVQEQKKTKFDICESLGRGLLTFERKINAKKLDVEVDFPERDVNVYAVEDSITQVLYNLLDNAVKFCPDGGRLRLKVEETGGKARITVANDGETIPEEELQLIFDRFHKTDKSRSMDKDGVGLGLYIVKTILASYNEDVTATSRDGVTAFSFCLPLAK